MFLTSGSNSSSPLQLIPVIFPFLIIGLALAAWFVCFIYGIVAAVMAFQGKDFRYVIISRQVEKYLG